MYVFIHLDFGQTLIQNMFYTLTSYLILPVMVYLMNHIKQTIICLTWFIKWTTIGRIVPYSVYKPITYIFNKCIINQGNQNNIPSYFQWNIKQLVSWLEKITGKDIIEDNITKDHVEKKNGREVGVLNSAERFFIVLLFLFVIGVFFLLYQYTKYLK